MEKPQDDKNDCVQLTVEPGICGFSGSIQMQRAERYSVKVTVTSRCQQIKSLAALLDVIALTELFLPLSKNPVFLAAEQAKCHPSCIYPTAILKAGEVALEMALPREIKMNFTEKR